MNDLPHIRFSGAEFRHHIGNNQAQLSSNVVIAGSLSSERDIARDMITAIFEINEISEMVLTNGHNYSWFPADGCSPVLRQQESVAWHRQFNRGVTE